jgi:hypothetical protein
VRLYKLKAFARFQRRERIGRAYLGLDEDGVEAAIAADELMEVGYDGEG